jgi:hypothetical protein
MEFEKNLIFKFHDQAENIATVGQAISYQEEAKNNNSAYIYACGLLFLKIKFKIEFQSKDIYCNTHGSFVIKYSKSMGFICLKITKIEVMVKTSCCYGFRCSYSYWK